MLILNKRFPLDHTESLPFTGFFHIWQVNDRNLYYFLIYDKNLSPCAVVLKHYIPITGSGIQFHYLLELCILELNYNCQFASHSKCITKKHNKKLGIHFL